MKPVDFDEAGFDRLNKRISSLIENEIVEKDHLSLIYIFLRNRLYLEDFDINESYTDGGNDCGVDAIYIDQRRDQPVVHLFQSKIHSSKRKASNPFKCSSIDKVTRFFQALKDRDADLKKIANPLLEQKILQIRDLQDREFPVFKLWLLSNGTPCLPQEFEISTKNLMTDESSVEEFHLHEFIVFCLDAKSSRVSHTFLTREAGVLEHGYSELRSFVGYISASQLYHLIKDIRDEKKIDYSLFDMNVRGFMGLDNPINKQIFKTAASSDNIHFDSLNNGITIVGSNCKIMRMGTELPKVGIKFMSIVNGAQTCSSIFEAMKDYYPDFSKFENLSILFRIFQTDDPELISRIAVSTNNQNRIIPRDLRANDEHQLRIERELAKKGIKYLRKRGTFEPQDEAERSLDALRAGQLILSYMQHEPARAKRDSDSIFTDSYPRIFADVDIDKLVEALEWFELIDRRRRYIQDEIRIKGISRIENSFVTYGVFHILMLCSILGPADSEEDKSGIIDDAIDIIARHLKNAGEPAFYAFFRDTKHTERLREAARQLPLFS